MLLFVTDVLALGLPSAQGLVLSNAFYWDLNEATRAWTKRFRAQKNRLPTMNQAGVYAGVRHYVRAVHAGSRDPKQAAAAMRALPVNDMYNEDVQIREDGRVLSRMYLMQVKAPADARSPDDVYQILSNRAGRPGISAAFRERVSAAEEVAGRVLKIRDAEFANLVILYFAPVV